LRPGIQRGHATTVATDLSVPVTNNEAERTLRPVKIQQRTSGGCWRTMQGFTDFAIVHSYLDTANKWGINKLDALRTAPTRKSNVKVCRDQLSHLAAAPRLDRISPPGPVAHGLGGVECGLFGAGEGW
jgi:Transposase IS66 family